MKTASIGKNEFYFSMYSIFTGIETISLHGKKECESVKKYEGKEKKGHEKKVCTYC